MKDTYITAFNSTTSEFLLVSVYGIRSKPIRKKGRRPIVATMKKVSVQAFESVAALDSTIEVLESKGHAVHCSPCVLDGLFDLDTTIWSQASVLERVKRLSA